MAVDRSRVRVGMELLAVHDEYLGRVQDVRDTAIRLHHRELRRDFYLPLSDIRRNVHDRVVLTVRGDEIEGELHPRPPSAPVPPVRCKGALLKT